jgi:hypothetical protein
MRIRRTGSASAHQIVVNGGTCPISKGCCFVGNICSEYSEDGMKFERHPKWYYNDDEGVIHMIDVTRRVICGEALVSIVISKVMMSTPKTAVENFLHAMVTASSKPDVKHHIYSRLELLKLCGMTTVFDVVAKSYRLHQANRFDNMNERTGETTIVAVCNTEYELFCEASAIWLVHQYCMQPSLHQPYMTPSQRRLFQNNRRDLGAVTVETERNNSVSENKSMQKYLWLGESGASYHLTNDTAGSRIHSYLKIGDGKYMSSSRVGKK